MAQPPQPDPVQTLNAIAGMSALTLGFLFGSQIIQARQIRRLMLHPPVKEVVVVYKEVAEGVIP